MKNNVNMVIAIFSVFVLSFVLMKKDLIFKNRKKSDNKLNLSSHQSLSFAKQLEASYKELKSSDIKVGSGMTASRGSLVTVHYISRLPDGKVFDSSVERNQPLVFPLGEARVLPGWDRGIEGMKVGGKRKLTVPPFLAYGEKGIANIVPPQSSVEFEIELLNVKVANR